MAFARVPDATAAAALLDASPIPYWLDHPDRPAPHDPLGGRESCALLVVGAGFNGLWTALLAKQQNPDRDVVLIDGGRIGWAASGRNGGFVAASITHGLANGASRWPDEMDVLLRLGHENLRGIADTIAKYEIDCDFGMHGELDTATEEHQIVDLRESVELAARYGEKLEFLEADQVRALVHSPLYRAGVRDANGVATVHPGRLAWGLAKAAADTGVRIYEKTEGMSLDEEHGNLVVRTRSADGIGHIVADRIALATSAFPPLLARLKHFIVPVYDYLVVTEPLRPDQWDSIGWAGREGIGDSGNQFHYYRRTADDRILFGGFDAVYRPRVDASNDQRPQSSQLLVTHLRQLFPVLHDVRISHTWGGAIDTCSRFSAFFGTARSGRVAYSAGYTGLGVGASRFGAAVMLDLLDDARTGRTENTMVRSMPIPFPPPPFRTPTIELTRWSLAQADQREGRRNLWLRTLDRLGLGFDS